MKTTNYQARQYGVTLFIIAMGVYCAIGRAELYPFAPYTMYSHKQSIVNNDFFKIYCLTGEKRFDLTSQMIYPLDEARLGVSVSESYYKKDFKLIVSKLSSLKELMDRNKFKCEKAKLDVVRFNGANELLARQGTVIHSEVSQ